MEILEIQSSHSLTTSIPEKRLAGVHSYHVNCRQFISLRRSWHRDGEAQGHALAVMTLGFERIWITAEETEQVAAAIQATHSPIALG